MAKAKTSTFTYFSSTITLPVCRSYREFLIVLKDKVPFTYLCHTLKELKKAKYHPRYCTRLAMTISSILQETDSDTLFNYLTFLKDNNLISVDPFDSLIKAREEFLDILSHMPDCELTCDMSAQEIYKHITASK